MRDAATFVALALAVTVSFDVSARVPAGRWEPGAYTVRAQLNRHARLTGELLFYERLAEAGPAAAAPLADGAFAIAREVAPEFATFDRRWAAFIDR